MNTFCSIILCFFICYFFFFQAEDGIRDDLVTGVQTCALPILSIPPRTQLDTFMARSPKLILFLASLLVRIDEAKAARPTLHQINGNEVLTTIGRRKSGRGSVPPIIMLCRQQLACLIINVDRDFLDGISCDNRK